MPSPSAVCTVYFDGGCPLCRREIAHYRRQEGAGEIDWVDAAACDPAALAGLPRDSALSRLHVRRADGALVSGAAAFAMIWTRLPAYGWLGRLAARRPVLALLETAYSAFARLRPLWRRHAGTTPALPRAVRAGLRANHAGAAGAVQVCRGVLAMARDGESRAFAAAGLARAHLRLQRVYRGLPATARSRRLPLWRAAGWLTGALPALFGRRAVYATVATVERFVDRHSAAQAERLSMYPELGELRQTLTACRRAEATRGEAAPARRQTRPRGPGGGWSVVVGRGSSPAEAGRRL